MKSQVCHFLSIADLGTNGLQKVLGMASTVKKTPSRFSRLLAGKGLAYYSEKPSTRTKLSFQAAILQMGGHYLDMADSHLSSGKEDAYDTSHVVSKYADFLAARVFKHKILEEFSASSSIPVINALSEKEHPCQALADLQTLLELKGKTATVAFVGDGNNVCTSLALGACMIGMNVHVSSPKGFELEHWILETCRQYAGCLELFDDPFHAVKDTDAVYTDVWMSMGDEREKQEGREQAFNGFQVNAEMMSLAKKEAVFMHCLPALKRHEVSRDVIEGPQSVVFEQAENRLHAQKALLAYLAHKEMVH